MTFEKRVFEMYGITGGFNTYDLSEVNTVLDLAEYWLSHIKQDRLDLKKRTVENYATSSDHFLEYIGHTPLDILSLATIADLRRKLSQIFQPSTVHLTIETLKMVLRWGIARGLTLGFQVENIQNKRPKPCPKPKAEEEDVEMLLQLLPDSDLRRMVFLARNTGARLGELTSLTWERFQKTSNRSGEEVYSVYVVGKANPRDISISKDTYDEVMKWKGDEANHCPIIHSNVNSNTLRGALRKHNLEEFTFNALRRLRGNELERTGLSPTIYSSQMGHSIRVASQHYLTTTTAEVSSALAELGVLH